MKKVEEEDCQEEVGERGNFTYDFRNNCNSYNFYNTGNGFNVYGYPWNSYMLKKRYSKSYGTPSTISYGNQYYGGGYGGGFWSRLFYGY